MVGRSEPRSRMGLVGGSDLKSLMAEEGEKREREREGVNKHRIQFFLANGEIECMSASARQE